MCPSTKLQCPSCKEHLCHRASERDHESTHRKCLAQSNPYKVYATVQAQPHLRNHSNLPIKPWVVKTTLPRWPEDLSLCEEWPFWGTHRLSEQVTPSQTTQPGMGMSASPVQTHSPLEGTRSGCSDWQRQQGHASSLSTLPVTDAVGETSVSHCGREEMPIRGNIVAFSLGKTLILVNPLNAEAYIC